MEITQPKRILLLAPSGVSSQPILDALTQGPKSTSTSKRKAPPSTHPTPSDPAAPDVPIHRIENSYYRASIPIWRDEVLSTTAWAEQWKAEDGAAEVIRAVGAWVVCFHKPVSEDEKISLTDLLTNITSVITHHTSTSSSFYSYDPSPDTILLAVAVSTSPTTSIVASAPDAGPNPTPAGGNSLSETETDSDLDLDDLCRAAGNWEYVNSSATSAKGQGDFDDYGETVGIERLLEALEGGEWDADGGGEGLDDDDEFGADDWEVGLEGEDGDGQQMFTGDVAAQLEALLGGSGRGAVDREDELGDGRDMQEALLGPKSKLGEESATKDLSADENEDGDDTWRVKERRTDSVSTAGAPAGETNDDVDALQAMMLKLQATRDLGADLPMAERRRIAKAAVQKVMKEMG